MTIPITPVLKWSAIVLAMVIVLLCSCVVGVIAYIGYWGQWDNSWQHFEDGGNYPAGNPSLSWSGEWLVYSSSRSGRGDLYVVSRTGDRHLRLTSSAATEMNPRFAPGDTCILYEHEENGLRHIWAMDFASRMSWPLTSGNVLEGMVGFDEESIGKPRLVIRRATATFTVGGRSSQVRTLELDADCRRVIAEHGGPIALPAASSQMLSPTMPVFEFLSLGLPQTETMRAIGGTWLPFTTPDGKRVSFDEDVRPTQLWRISIPQSNSASKQGIL